MTPDQQTAADLRREGHTRAQIARAMGKSETAVKSLLRRAKKWADADPAARQAATVAGSNAIPHSFWVKTDSHSVYYRTPQDAPASDLLVEIAEAMRDVPAYRPNPIAATNDGLMTVYPLMDAHFGMRAWGRETGGDDYDLDHARNDVLTAFERLWSRTPKSDHAVLILGGDTLHADDNEGHTQSRKHVVDTDGRLYKVAEVAIHAICNVIDGLSERHSRVTVRVLRGNHDPHAHFILHFALTARYRLSEMVTIEDAARDMFWIRHGRSLIASHHGDKSGPRDLAMYLADTCPEWSLTRDRHILTGHIHHDSVKDFPGVKWWSLRAFCQPDEYGSRFGSRRALQAMTFCAKDGLILHGIEGVRRGN